MLLRQNYTINVSSGFAAFRVHVKTAAAFVIENTQYLDIPILSTEFLAFVCLCLRINAN